MKILHFARFYEMDTWVSNTKPALLSVLYIERVFNPMIFKSWHNSWFAKICQATAGFKSTCRQAEVSDHSHFRGNLLSERIISQPLIHFWTESKIPRTSLNLECYLILFAKMFVELKEWNFRYPHYTLLFLYYIFNFTVSFKYEYFY